jgi:hypothetical protein
MRCTLAALSSLFLVAAPRAQVLFQDTFDASPGTPFKLGTDTGPGPVLLAGDPYAGSFLRLISDNVASQNNHWTYPTAAPGLYRSLRASWDFRGFSSVTNQAADGFSFQLIPTATYPSGDGPNVTAEEPNLAGLFAVGFDLHPADGATPVNDLSGHWDGFEQVNHRLPANVTKLVNGQFHRLLLELDQVGNSSLATLRIVPNISGAAGATQLVYRQIMPMLRPYENRIQFAGRTGGRHMDVDIDNLSVLWTNAVGSVTPATPHPRLFQDFDHLGATPFTAAQHADSVSGIFRPGVLPIDSGSARSVFARLVHDNVNTSRNSIAFHRGRLSQASSRRVVFDFRLTSAANPADGLALLLLPTATYGLRGAGPNLNSFEKPNLPGTLAVGLDLYDAINDVSVHHGSELLNVGVPPGAVDFNDGNWHRLQLDAVSVAGGMAVTVRIHPDVDGAAPAPVTAIENLFLADVHPYEWRVQLGARTGGSYMNVDVDNIRDLPGPHAAALPLTAQNFDGGGTHYEIWRNPIADTNETTPIPLLDEGGPNRRFLRLTSAGQTNSRNAAALEAALDAATAAPGRVTVAEFAFRATENAANGNPGDGLGFMLIPTAVYGVSGFGASTSNAYSGVEEPNQAGVLAVGVDLYDKRLGVNDLSLHWNAVERSNLRLDPITQANLTDARFHHVKMRVHWDTPDSRVDLVLTTNVYGAAGAPLVLLDKFPVPGLTGYAHRLEVAARTGGSTVSLDVDDLLVQTVATNTYAYWITAQDAVRPAQRAPELDVEGDTLVNLVEYFAALSPSAPDEPPLRALNGEAAGSFRFTYRRNPLAADVTHAFEWTTDLLSGQWFPEDGDHFFTEQVIGGDTSHDLVEVTLTTTQGEERLYVRLKLALNL